VARVYAGSVARLALHARESGRDEVSTLSVGVSQPAGAAGVWLLRLEPRFDEQAVVRELGRVETVPPLAGARPSGVCAIGCAPGAVGWIVQVERLRSERGSPDPRDDLLDVDLAAYPTLLDPGVTAIPGQARLVTEPTFSYLSGAVPPGNSQVLVPPGFDVVTFSAWQDGVGGAIKLGTAGPFLPLPPSGAAHIAPRGGFSTDPAGALLDFVAFPAGGGGWLLERSRG